MKLYVANVGVNTSSARQRGLKSPVFPDDTFEFVPIKEAARFAIDGMTTYTDITAVNGHGESLAAYLPKKTAGYAAHNDPEFVTFTYGDVMSPRASNLQYIKPGDELWFLARLWDFKDARWSGASDFYFIGKLFVEQNILIPENTSTDNIHPTLQERIHNNAHYRRLVSAETKDPFRIIIGDCKRSARFCHALRVTPDVAALLYAASYDEKNDTFIRQGQVVRNRSNPRPRRFSYFGSTTRSIQAFLDSENPSDEPYLEELQHIASRCIQDQSG